MQFLSSAIVTTLVIFLMLLPSFIVLRVFWGRSRGSLNADNIYPYLVWGIALSISIYGIFFGFRIYRLVNGSHPFPTTLVWNLFAKEENKIDSLDSTVRKTIVNDVFIRKDSVFKIFLTYSKIQQKPIYDTVQVINKNSLDNTDTLQNNYTYAYVISKNAGRNPLYKIRSDTVFASVKIYQPDSVEAQGNFSSVYSNHNGLFEEKYYLIKQFFLLLLLSWIGALLLRFLVQFLHIDRFKKLRLQSDLHYILSGRQHVLESDKWYWWPYSKVYYPRVDLLCQIGEQIKIYQGIVREFKVKDECLEYLVLECTKRGNLASEKTNPPKPHSEDLELTSFNIGKIDDIEISISAKPNDITKIVQAIQRRPDFGNDVTKLDYISMEEGVMYFKHDQIKNIYIQYLDKTGLSKARNEYKSGQNANQPASASAGA